MGRKPKEEFTVFEEEGKDGQKLVTIQQESPFDELARVRPVDMSTEEADLQYGMPEEQNHIKSVSKELFSGDNIDTKTQLSHNDINNITRLRFLSEKFGVENVDVLTNSMLTLRVSMNRKSREEFIASLQTENRNQQGGTWVERLLGARSTKNQEL